MKNLLNDTKTVVFGNKVTNEVPRATVVVVIYNKATNTYLCQYWEDYKGLTCLLSGGVEKDERADDAVLREIAEETGYADFEVVGQLGGMIETHYTKATGEDFVKHITPYFVVLNSLAHEAHQREEDEKFENLFKDSQEIIAMMEAYETATGSLLADHKEILRRGVEFATNQLLVY